LWRLGFNGFLTTKERSNEERHFFTAEDAEVRRGFHQKQILTG